MLNPRAVHYIRQQTHVGYIIALHNAQDKTVASPNQTFRELLSSRDDDGLFSNLFLKKHCLGGRGSYFHFLLSHPHFFFSFFIEINLLNPTFRGLQERKRLNLLHLCNKASIKPAKKHIHPVACMHIAKIKGVNRSVTTNRPAILRHIQFFTIMLSCCNVIALLSII